jgi:hypothetical protein
MGQKAQTARFVRLNGTWGRSECNNWVAIPTDYDLVASFSEGQELCEPRLEFLNVDLDRHWTNLVQEPGPSKVSEKHFVISIA